MPEAEGSSEPQHNQSVAELSRNDLLQLYSLAVADYQFQVNLTWSRTQYCLTLNSAIIAVAAGLINFGRGPTLSGTAVVLVVGVFASGLLMSAFSILALDMGRRYYRPVVNRIKVIEKQLGIDAEALKTTRGQGGVGLPITITQLLKFLFGGLALIDVLGIVYILSIGAHHS